MLSKHLIKYILTAAMRDRLMMTLLLMMALIAAGAVFLGATAVTEQDRFALVFSAGALRFLGVMGLILFCCFYIRRSFENKEVEFLLSRPITRLSFLFSHAAAFAILSLLTAVGAALAVAATGRPDMAGLVVWGASLACEYAIMAVAALFFSMVLPSAAASALATLGFYALARMMGQLLLITALVPANWLFAALNSIMELISVIMPRFDLMGQTTWLVYGVGENVGIKFLPDAGAYTIWMAQHLGLSGLIAVQGLIFMALIFTAAFYDFLRKQF